MVEAGKRGLERDGHRPAWPLRAISRGEQREDDLDLAGGVCGGGDDAGFRHASGKDRRPVLDGGVPGHAERGGPPVHSDEDAGESNRIVRGPVIGDPVADPDLVPPPEDLEGSLGIADDLLGFQKKRRRVQPRGWRLGAYRGRGGGRQARPVHRGRGGRRRRSGRRSRARVGGGDGRGDDVHHIRGALARADDKIPDRCEVPKPHHHVGDPGRRLGLEDKIVDVLPPLDRRGGDEPRVSDRHGVDPSVGPEHGGVAGLETQRRLRGCPEYAHDQGGRTGRGSGGARRAEGGGQEEDPRQPESGSAHALSLRNCSIRSVPHWEMLRPSKSSLLLSRRIFSWSTGTASAARVLRSTPLKKRSPPEAGGLVLWEATSSSTHSRMVSCIKRPSSTSRARNRRWSSLGTWIPILTTFACDPAPRALPRAARATHMPLHPPPCPFDGGIEARKYLNL